jgi:hypothetical protein
MCSIGLIATGLQIGSGVYQARAQYQAGLAQASFYDFQAKQAEQEAVLSQRYGQRQSEAVQESAKLKSKGLARTQAKEASSQRAALAASGVQGVTAEDIQREAFDVHQFDQATLRYNADLQSYSIIEDASYRSFAAKSQASQFRAASGFAKSSAKRNAFTTLIGTAVSVISPFAASPFKGLFSSGNVAGTGIFGTKLFGQTQSQILGFNTGAYR